MTLFVIHLAAATFAGAGYGLWLLEKDRRINAESRAAVMEEYRDIYAAELRRKDQPK